MKTLDFLPCAESGDVQRTIYISLSKNIVRIISNFVAAAQCTTISTVPASRK
nr:hypothetical protein [Candidatus Kuenenia stuttgartiensis]